MSQPFVPSNAREAGERAHLLGSPRQPCWKKMGARLIGGVRRIRSKGAALTVLQHYFVSAYLCTVLWLMNEFKREKDDNVSFPVQLYGPLVGIFFVFTLGCPIAGWLADVHYGRYRMIRFGIRMLWIGAVFGAVWLLVLNHYSSESDKELLKYLKGGGGSLFLLILSIGFTSFAVNIFQFGVDQIPEASAQELTSLIHWLVWATFAGEVTARVVYPIRYCVPGFSEKPYIAGAIQWMIPATMITFAVSCDFLFRGWLIKEPDRQNPLWTIALILKFAATHKHPLRHHAAMHWLAENPTRIDFAKDKYGGPFTSEQVEDLKTFFRMMVVIISSWAFVIPIFLYMESVRYLWAVNIAFDKPKECKDMGIDVSRSPSVCAILIIPLYEFVIHPVIRNRVPSMLVRAGIAAVITAMLSGVLLAVNAITHVLKPETACMFTKAPYAHKVMHLAVWLDLPSSILAAIAIALFSAAMLEFTYAQSPYNMRGTLIGSLLSVVIATAPIALGAFIAWSQFNTQIKPSCDFYYFLFVFLCALIGVAVLCAVARNYKWRQREECSNPGIFEERLYSRVGHE